jgi:starch phosphorylase
MPPELQPLGELAYDLWWSWQPGGHALFRDVDPDRWDDCGQNPIKLLRYISRERLAVVARDATLLERIRALHDAWRRERERPFERSDVATVEHPIAFVCAEFGLDASLPIYSGGLGVLAGDVLKQASDSGVPMVGLGLLYRRGYFRQRLDRSGWQHEYWTVASPEELPVAAEVDAGGAPRLVHVQLRGRPVAARIWRVEVGRTRLYLLDTDVPENDLTSRWITSTLYVADRAMRLMQYAVLAMGGVRALRLLGIDPTLFHLNEGHASLAALELLREERARGVPFETAIAAVRKRIVFTTHTPVAAGNEHYDGGEVAAVLGDLAKEVGIEHRELIDLARGGAQDRTDRLGVTELALRTARATNGVSRKHGETARGMWQHIWPGRDAGDVPIAHVTNGVHLPTWMAGPMRELLDRHLGPDWIGKRDPAIFDRLDAIPDAELWAVRNALRARLVSYVRSKTIADRLARGESIEYSEAAAQTFDPDTLTIGFARRVAAYKRLHLLIRDPGRAMALLGGRKVQVVIAGRAHPADDGAKQLVKSIFDLKDVEHASRRVAFLEDYDLATAHELVAGCDLWLNLPRAPLEASGTSGMKAALNGGLNLSVLDGWWCEAFEEGVTGWGIASAKEADEATQDSRDAQTLFGLLERDVMPRFYDRDAGGIPRAWLRLVRGSLRRVASSFTARRMLDEYAARVWRPPA